MRGSSQQGLQHAFDFACNQAGTKISTKNLRYCVLKTPKAVNSVRERKYTAAGRDVQVAWGGIHE